MNGNSCKILPPKLSQNSKKKTNPKPANPSADNEVDQARARGW